jgi:2-desacetyl-2-hydroxyethyl bacteriochlorophyllide A dehydrogenase
MKALVYPEFDRLEVREVPDPAPGPGEVLIRVGACGICGSELTGFAHRSPRRPPPLVMGHEFAGTVAALGPGVSGLEPGRRVMVNSLVHCGECDMCRRGATHLCRDRQVFGMHRPGAFAEFVAVPAGIVFPLPEEVSALQGSLVEPLANAVHVLSLASGNPMETVLICGAGTIGLMCLQAAKALGAGRVAITETHPHRRDLAAMLGASVAADPRERTGVDLAGALTEGRGFDLAIDAVGVPSARVDAVSAVRPGGEVVWIGLHDSETTLNAFDVILPERRIQGSYGATDADIRTSIRLFAEGKIRTDPWVHVFPLSQGAEVFLDALHQRLPGVKAVLEP